MHETNQSRIRFEKWVRLTGALLLGSCATACTATLIGVAELTTTASPSPSPSDISESSTSPTASPDSDLGQNSDPPTEPVQNRITDVRTARASAAFACAPIELNWDDPTLKDTYVQLDGDGFGLFSDSQCSAPAANQPLQVTALSTSLTLYGVFPVTGSYSVTLSDGQNEFESQSIPITAEKLHFNFNQSRQPSEVDECAGEFTITAQDGGGNPVFWSVDPGELFDIELTADYTHVYPKSNCSNEDEDATLLIGNSIANPNSFYLKSSFPEQLQIVANIPDALGEDVTVTFTSIQSGSSEATNLDLYGPTRGLLGDCLGPYHASLISDSRVPSLHPEVTGITINADTGLELYTDSQCTHPVSNSAFPLAVDTHSTPSFFVKPLVSAALLHATAVVDPSSSAVFPAPALGIESYTAGFNPTTLRLIAGSSSIPGVGPSIPSEFGYVDSTLALSKFNGTQDILIHNGTLYIAETGANLFNGAANGKLRKIVPGVDAVTTHVSLNEIVGGFPGSYASLTRVGAYLMVSSATCGYAFSFSNAYLWPGSTCAAGLFPSQGAAYYDDYGAGSLSSLIYSASSDGTVKHGTSVLVSGLGTLGQLVGELNDGYLYVTQKGTGTNGQVLKISRTTGAVTPLVSNLVNPIGLTFLTDTFYLSGGSDANHLWVKSFPVSDPSAIQTLYESSTHRRLDRLAVYGSDIYGITIGGSSVTRIAEVCVPTGMLDGAGKPILACNVEASAYAGQEAAIPSSEPDPGPSLVLAAEGIDTSTLSWGESWNSPFMMIRMFLGQVFFNAYDGSARSIFYSEVGASNTLHRAGQTSSHSYPFGYSPAFGYSAGNANVGGDLTQYNYPFTLDSKETQLNFEIFEDPTYSRASVPETDGRWLYAIGNSGTQTVLLRSQIPGALDPTPTWEAILDETGTYDCTTSDKECTDIPAEEAGVMIRSIALQGTRLWISTGSSIGYLDTRALRYTAVVGTSDASQYVDDVGSNAGLSDAFALSVSDSLIFFNDAEEKIRSLNPSTLEVSTLWSAVASNDYSSLSSLKFSLPRTLTYGVDGEGNGTLVIATDRALLTIH